MVAVADAGVGAVGGKPEKEGCVNVSDDGGGGGGDCDVCNGDDGLCNGDAIAGANGGIACEGGSGDSIGASRASSGAGCSEAALLSRNLLRYASSPVASSAMSAATAAGSGSVVDALSVVSLIGGGAKE